MVFGSLRPNRLCRASQERGPRWRLRLPSSTASASEKDNSLKTGEEHSGGGSWNRRMWFRRELLLRQPRRTMRATEVLRRQRSRVCGLSNPYCDKRRNSAGSSVAGTSRPLLARAPVRVWRCLGSVVGREARAQTHANRPSVPKNNMKTVAKLLPLKHPVGSRHNKFLRRITLRDLTVTGKCNKSGWSWANSGLTKTAPKHPLAKMNRTELLKIEK